MKKQLLIALAICVLFLSACGSQVATSTTSGNSAAHSTAPITTQSVCHVLQGRQVQLNQQYQAARAQFNAAQAHGNAQQAGEAEKTLIRLHQSIVQVQAQRKAC